MHVQKWDVEKNGEISLENFRKLFTPEDCFAVRWKRCEPARFDSTPTAVSGWQAGFTLYVISGRCRITIGAQDHDLEENDYLEFPWGDYHLKVTSDIPLEYLMVMKLSFPPIESWSVP